VRHAATNFCRSSPLQRRRVDILFAELLWQIRRRIGFLWASSGILIELMVHQVDECCWIKDAWPIEAQGIGGRTANSRDCSQNPSHQEYSPTCFASVRIIGG
jgi:hypothetical protein